MNPKIKRILAWLGIILVASIFFAIVYNGINPPTSVGIIGGSDGPTAIFLSARETNWVEVILLSALAVGILYYIKQQDKKNEK